MIPLLLYQTEDHELVQISMNDLWCDDNGKIADE